MLGIYRFKFEPYGDPLLSGLFIATDKQIAQLIKQGLDLGECLGKHTRVWFEPGELEEHIELVTSDSNAIIIFNNNYMTTGFDLTLYLNEDD